MGRGGDKVEGGSDSKVLQGDIYLAFAQYRWVVVSERRVRRTHTGWGTFSTGYFRGCGKQKEKALLRSLTSHPTEFLSCS